MNKKVNLFASFKKEKAQLKKEEQAKAAEGKAVSMKLGTTRRLVISFLITVMFFCICMVMIKNLTVEEETVPVMVAVKAIPVNTKVTADSGYFAVKNIPISLLPEGSLKDIQQVAGQFTVCDVEQNQILSGALFRDKKAAAFIPQNPLEVSVGTASIAQIVGGTIREGDFVNISSVKGSYEIGADGASNYVYTAVSIVEKAYVTRAFTAAGAVVDSQDEEQPVTVINIIISAEQEEAFNIAMEEGTLRVSRIWD